jgi:Ala-tRNA(Pro) deacylase
MNSLEEKVYALLKELKIPFVIHTHPPVYTVEEANQYWGSIEGAHCKNLLLRNKKGTAHYLLIAEGSKKIDLRQLTSALGEDRLSFASPERLMKYLGLTPGAVSPFGLINDRSREVRVIIDEELKRSGRVNFHPNVNTSTVGIDFSDFEKFLSWCGNSVMYINVPIESRGG